jgi:signal transduction histidine kinase
MQQTPLILATFLIVIAIITVLVGLIGIFLLLYQKRQHAYFQNLEDVKAKYEHEILTSQLELQEQTIQHYSREIHDNIGQYISLSKLTLIAIGEKVEKEISDKINNAVDLLTKALHDLRDLSKSLGLASIRENGLSRSIEEQAEQLAKTKKYKVDFSVIGNYNYLDEQIEIILFRILQEAISNIIRHASANTIDICLDCSAEGSTTMIVRDNGVGFDTSRYLGTKPSFPSGGLRNMLIRAKVIRATFTIKSEPGIGTSICILVPHNDHENER